MPHQFSSSNQVPKKRKGSSRNWILKIIYVWVTRRLTVWPTNCLLAFSFSYTQLSGQTWYTVPDWSGLTVHVSLAGFGPVCWLAKWLMTNSTNWLNSWGDTPAALTCFWKSHGRWIVDWLLGQLSHLTWSLAHLLTGPYCFTATSVYLYEETYWADVYHVTLYVHSLATMTGSL